MDIIDAKGWNTLDRMKMLQKPMFIDEVGTTAVNYDGAYNYNTSLQVYATQTDAKNQRLLQLRDFLKSQPQILGANYFNVDLTNGLKNWTIGELDRSVIDFQSNKFYDGIINVYNAGEKIEKNTSPLLAIFNVKYMNLSGVKLLVPSQYLKPIKDLYAALTT